MYLNHCVYCTEMFKAKAREKDDKIERLETRVAELEGFVESLRNRLSAKDAGFPVRGPRRKADQ